MEEVAETGSNLMTYVSYGMLGTTALIFLAAVYGCFKNLLKTKESEGESEMQEQTDFESPETKERIDLEYLVEFEDGLKPKLVVEYEHPETKKREFWRLIGLPEVGASKGARVFYNTGMHIKSLGCCNLGEGDPEKEYEKMINDMRDHKANLVRADSVERLHDIIDEHFRRYREQFRPLAENFAEQFENFALENPAYFTSPDSELADAEGYVVSYNDSLKPLLIVYYIDREKNKIITELNYSIPEINVFMQEIIMPEQKISTDILGRLGSKTEVDEFALEYSEQAEQGVIEKAKKAKVNVIKVDSFDQVVIARQEHFRKYTEQFEPLVERFADQFLTFLKEHPGYFPDTDFSKTEPRSEDNIDGE